MHLDVEFGRGPRRGASQAAGAGQGEEPPKVALDLADVGELPKLASSGQVGQGVACRVSCVCPGGQHVRRPARPPSLPCVVSPPVSDCFTAKFLQQGKDAFTVDGQIAQRVRIDDESDAATASSPESLPVRHDSTPFRTHHQRTAASLHPLEQRPVNLTFALC